MTRNRDSEPRVMVVKSKAVERARRAAERGALMPPATMTVYPTRHHASDGAVALSKTAATPTAKKSAKKSAVAPKPRRR